jgi:hypothetical protein
MKKKIVFGLAIFALMFFFGGVYIVTTTETTIYDLHRLSQLHRTVALRKDLLLAIKKTQSGIISRGKQFVWEETVGDESTVGILKKCLDCHQTSPSREAITFLKNQIETYHEKARAVFAARPGSSISESRAGTALRLGDDLIGKIEGIITLTSTNLEKQEREILEKIRQ